MLQIQTAYMYVKILKDILELDIKSYFVKKFLLRPEYKNIGNKKAEEILIEIMTHAEFRQKFEQAVQFEECWEGRGEDMKKKCQDWVKAGRLRLKQDYKPKQSKESSADSCHYCRLLRDKKINQKRLEDLWISGKCDVCNAQTKWSKVRKSWFWSSKQEFGYKHMCGNGCDRFIVD